MVLDQCNDDAVEKLRGTKKFCLVTLHNDVYNVIKYILEGETDGS